MPQWNSFDAFLTDAHAANSDHERQALVDALLIERTQWPWVEEDKATFIYARPDVTSVAVNLDTIPNDPPFAPMISLEGTTLWYVTIPFSSDDLLDYMLAVNDPMTPLATETDVIGRVSRYWGVDPRNPTRMDTAQMNVSVLRMPHSRPFPDWTALKQVPRGRITETTIDSEEVGFRGRKVWIYTPNGYENSGTAYPLLIFNDGQWGVGPLQAPAIADALIKHNRMRPAVIVMIQSGSQDERINEYVGNDAYYQFLLTELLPHMQTHYRIDSTQIAIGGVAMGAIAAAHAALKNPAVFTGLIMISPPLGRGPMQEKLMQYQTRFAEAETLPRRIFLSVGRYEARARFLKPAQALDELLKQRRNIAYQYAEVGSGHGLVGFRSMLPEAMAWVLPGEAF